MSPNVVSFVIFILFFVSATKGGRDNVNLGKNCRDAFSLSLLHNQSTENFGHKFATDVDAKFILQVTIEDSVTQSIKAKCTGNLITPEWVITSSDCGLELRHDNALLPFLKFKVSTGIDFGDSEESITSAPKVTMDVLSVKSLSIDTVCTPMLLKLKTPMHDRPVVCLSPETHVSPSNVVHRGLSLGWSTLGNTSILERILRVTGVRVDEKHCMHHDNSPNRYNSKALSCVSYTPQTSFYFLSGSPLLHFKQCPSGQKEIFLEGLACSDDLAIKMVNESLVYRQTFLKISYFSTTIQQIIQEDSHLFYSTSYSSWLDTRYCGSLFRIFVMMCNICYILSIVQSILP
jgi:hypothetical protein